MKLIQFCKQFVRNIQAQPIENVLKSTISLTLFKWEFCELMHEVCSSCYSHIFGKMSICDYLLHVCKERKKSRIWQCERWLSSSCLSHLLFISLRYSLQTSMIHTKRIPTYCFYFLFSFSNRVFSVHAIGLFLFSRQRWQWSDGTNVRDVNRWEEKTE